MRIRAVKPEFWPHPVMARQSDEVRLAALGLLNISDDEGYFLADPALIRSELWPFDESSTKARRALAQLCVVGWIEVKTHPTHGDVGWVVNFTKHQRIDRPSASKLKSYFFDERSTIIRRGLDERSLLDQGSGIRDQGEDQGSLFVPPPSVPIERLQSPKGDTGRGVGEASPGKPSRTRNPAFDALVEVCGGNPSQVTPGEGGRVAKALSDIRQVTSSLDLSELAVEIRRRAANYASAHPEWEMTPTAISTHWSTLDANSAPKAKPQRANGYDSGHPDRMDADVLKGVKMTIDKKKAGLRSMASEDKELAKREIAKLEERLARHNATYGNPVPE